MTEQRQGLQDAAPKLRAPTLEAGDLAWKDSVARRFTPNAAPEASPIRVPGAQR